jgi:hypothetical protein
MSEKTIICQTPIVANEIPGVDDLPKVGEWYWVKGTEERWLGCVTHVGSNYASVRGPSVEHSNSEHSRRIHLDEFDETCEREHAPDDIIEREIGRHRMESNRLMGEVRELTARLAIAPRSTLAPGGDQNEVHALVVRGASHESMDSYKNALVKAKEKTLPDLFKEIESENDLMGSWMKAKLIPLRAEADAMRSSIALIEDRVFNVELYAGLVETVTQIADGKGAAPDEPIYLMQRRHYMDEECLANYKTGGMEFHNIRDFNKWLAKRENTERILPHQRCIVAFRVRRNDKEHNCVNLSDFIKIHYAHEADATTFLYVRNGRQLYALQTEIEFGEKLFPDIEREALDRGELWGKMFGSRVEEIISDARHQDMIEENARAKAEYDEMVKNTPKKDRWNKHGSYWPPNDPDRYEKFTPESVYFDDIAKYVAARAKEHNRLALVLQGLLDRSPVFLPHPRWQIYTEAGFRAGIRLVHDDSRALAPAEKPDFEVYRARLNASLKTGSVTVGQEEVWERREAAKENARDRHRNVNYKHYRPYGNPGPGTLARVAHFAPRAKKCSFIWERDRSWSSRRYNSFQSSTIETSLVLSSSEVLNVDAYKPGDFKQFYADPRTRAEYLKWAPLLLESEEYHAGNRKLRGEGGGDVEAD